jgi:enoyl-CoA hydratase
VTTYTGIEHLSVALDGNVLSVTFNRPESLNSLTVAMVETLCDGGAGRGFCAGAGISAEDQIAARDGGTAVDALLEAINRVIPLIAGLPKPVVAVVHGPAAGVGVSLALACDIVLASDTAYFLLAFTKIGLMPDGGASALVAASIGRARAMKMALLAERLPANEAFECGLVSSVHPADGLEAEAAAVIERLATGPAAALRTTKQAINAATLTELAGALARETEGQLMLLHNKDFREGTRAFQERRSPVFTDE